MKQKNKRIVNSSKSLATVRESYSLGKRGSHGITLVALVITIIVLMILAGVSLSFVLGDNGILKKAQESADAYKNASQSEQQTLQNIENYLYGEKGGNNTGNNTTGGGGTPNPPTTNKISKSTSYVGYYADIDGKVDGTVDGVIFADKAVGNQGSGKWNDLDGVYTIPKVTEGLKDYYISQKSYTGKFGTKPVISPTGTGEERFYIMALTDIDGKTNGTEYDWWNEAIANIPESLTSEEFETGKTNTATMIEKWNAKAYGEQDECSDHKDMWGQIQTKVKDGWFVPSKAEWAAFGGELGISEDSSNEKYYVNFGLSHYYWSSSLCDTYGAWCANFGSGYMNGFTINTSTYVRLGATF